DPPRRGRGQRLVPRPRDRSRSLARGGAAGLHPGARGHLTGTSRGGCYDESVGKKFTLPLFPSEETAKAAAGEGQKPSIEAARKRLGGLPSTGRGASPTGLAPGVVVAFGAGARGIGVVIYADAAEVHVLLDPVRLRRIAPRDVTVHAGDTPEPLAKIAAD